MFILKISAGCSELKTCILEVVARKLRSIEGSLLAGPTWVGMSYRCLQSGKDNPGKSKQWRPGCRRVRFQGRHCPIGGLGGRSRDSGVYEDDFFSEQSAESRWTFPYLLDVALLGIGDRHMP